jgi:hypothetical protein
MNIEKRQVYGIFEKETGNLVYVGKTRGTLEQRWFYHTWKENWSRSPIRKYMEEKGYEKFEICNLRYCEDEQELDDWEKHAILECNPKYNVKVWSGW